MLNELHQLAKSLQKAGISPKEWHKQLREIPKSSNNKPRFLIYLSQNGSVSKIEELNEELAVNLRKWETSNGMSFPGFNIKPLFRITDPEQKKRIKSWRDGKESVDVKLLAKWCSEDCRNWNTKLKTKLIKCLIEVPQNFLSIIESHKYTDLSIITLCTRSISQKDPERFQLTLEKYLWKCLKESDSLKLALSLLVHEGDPGKIKIDDIEKDSGNLSVFLDIPDWKDYPVANNNSINWLNDILIAASRNDETSGAIDAFGNGITGSAEKLPSVKLPIIADVKLRAMNSESPCQLRYSTIDAFSFPIGHISRKVTKGALEWLGDDSREGETWGRADAKELIFAYPSTLPKTPVKLTTCLGAGKHDNLEARFADAAKDAIKGLQGISKELRNLNLNVFSLKKMDKARTKVVFHRNYTAQRLVEAADEWQEGCTNIPDFHVRVWGDKKGEWIVRDLIVPFPLQIANCLNRVWKMNGTTECEAVVISKTKGIELLLEEESNRFVNHLLSVLLQNTKGLLLFLGNAQNKGEIINVKWVGIHNLLIPSILGLMLYKLNYKKEVYMNNAAFLIGRMMKLADELHALYCKEVRDNNMPPQLVGNTLMTAALDSPTQALAQLALRIKPYYGWARTFQKGENAKLAGYYIGLYADTAAELSKHQLPSRFKDPERAQVLLGYLASNPKKSEKQNDSVNTEVKN